jgi:hypothetical protein
MIYTCIHSSDFNEMINLSDVIFGTDKLFAMSTNKKFKESYVQCCYPPSSFVQRSWNGDAES